MYKYIEGDGKISALVDSTSNDIAVNLAKYKEILNKYYLGDIDEEKLAEGSIKGYIEGLDDPYTEYIPIDVIIKVIKAVSIIIIAVL